MEQDSSYKVDTLEKSSDIEDRISELPNSIICYIFTFLNLKEVIRTKALSDTWKDRSMDMSILVFDPTIINIDLDDVLSLESMPLPKKYQFIERVDQLLEILTINQSVSFTIWFPLGKQFTSHIDKWINRAIEKECEKLDLEFQFARIDDEPYDFPFHILLSSKKSHLKCLSLCECQLKPTREVVHRLNLLESLTLVYVSMEASDLEILLSSCLNLEFLHLIDCKFLSHAHNNNQTPKFNNLTHLELTPKGDYGWNVSIGILYKSPKLEVLAIEVSKG
ncbi:hypothetical protein TanjilG_10172 [Lupinus angustifolius]|uniref:F-box domain-containing protein n=1 Tax=Lupinus angustifolius TaxID=3871 RepID=A0A4P1RBL1_LUPAN|nr:hypothetical protein TanjilG_10172 [Lupinus angustifolius]